MRCFFWGTNNRTDRDLRGLGITSFAVPDWGIQFRAAHSGTATECEYTALFALQQFVEKNPKAFEGTKLEFYSDAAAVIYQVNRQNPVPPSEARLWAIVRQLRTKRPFELCWIPREQNYAYRGVMDLAPLKVQTNFEFPGIEKARPKSPPTTDTPLI